MLSDILPFVIVGISSGAVYGMAGAGLVLTYKTSGIFNFAHGALATVAAYGFYALHVQYNVPWPVAAVICLFVAGPVFGFGFELLGRRIARAPLVWRVVATVGVMLTIEAVCTLIYGVPSRLFPDFLPTETFGLAGTEVTYETLIITVVSVVVTGALYVFLRTARAGKAMRAVVDDPDLLALSSTNPVQVRRYAWVIGCSFAALSGLLLGPSVGLAASTLTLLVVQAFGAAAIGRFTSLPLTWLGGLVIGLAASIATKYVPSSSSLLGGLPPSLPFIVLFVILLAVPLGRLATREPALVRRPVPWSTPNRVQVLIGIFWLIFLGIVPLFAGIHLGQWTQAVALILLFASLGLLTRISGQVSLCHAGFAAIGAVAFSRLTESVGIPWWPALVLSGLILIPVGAVIAVPAIRLGGIYLALATFGVGLLLQNMFYQTSWMFGSNGAGIEVPMPDLNWLPLSSSDAFYYIVLAIVLVGILIVLAVTRSRLGRLLRGISDSPTAVATGGASVTVSLVLVFCLSAFLAGVSGAIFSANLGVVQGPSFDPFLSLTWFVLILITAGGLPWCAIIAALAFTLIPSYVNSPETADWMQAAFGVSAVAIALVGQGEVPGPIRAALDRLGKRKSSTARDRPAAPWAWERERPRPRDLVVKGLTVRFGGLVAVREVSLSARSGQITGLIGPNGAGKTTIFNACSGLIRPTSGVISFGEVEVSRQRVAERARSGIGRSFQQPELYESMTVEENVMLGCETGLAGGSPIRQLVGRRGERDRTIAAAGEAMGTCGLHDVASVRVVELPTGRRRLVELARCLAGQYDLLLLDEPSAGLDATETAEFARALREVSQRRGISILLVEHDMSLVMGVCDHIWVLDFGSVIFDGPPSDVQASEVVRAAYLGSTEIGEVDMPVGNQP
jgi:ABC-type branched-subunit amino acid transport system ATPase component/branched-subunit amino acid ABC-type transport system permease component